MGIVSENPLISFPVNMFPKVIREELTFLVILGCKAEDSDRFPLPCNIL